MKLKLRHVLMASAAAVAFSGQAHADGHATWASKSKAKVAISGQIQRAFFYVDDGTSQRIRHGEQGQSESGVDFKGSTPVNKDVTASFHIDMDVDTQQQNPDGTVSGGFAGEASGDINTPKVYMALKHNTLGTVSIGRTSAASDGVAHTSLHGAYGFSAALMLTNIGDITLRDADDGSAAVNIDTRMSTVISDPGGRSPMIRYDTPRVNGLAAAVSHEDAGHIGTGINYGGSAGDLKLAIKAAYHHGDGDANDGLAGAFAAMHSSGITAGFNYVYTMDGVGSTTDASTTDDPDIHEWFAHAGYKAKFSDMGSTYLGVEFQESRDMVSGSEGHAFGIGFSQNVDSAALSFYGKFIHVNVVEPGANYDNVHAVESGVRLLF